MFKKKLQTSKPIMSNPITIENKTFIPISYIDITILDLKNPSIYGTVDSKGVVVIEEGEHHFLKVDEDYDLENAIDSIPELQEILNSAHKQ